MAVDLRALPCGGWKAAKLGIEQSGQWCRFIDHDTGEFINPATRIDFAKRYVPPRRGTAERAAPAVSREAAIDQLFVSAIGTLGQEGALPPAMRLCFGLRDPPPQARAAPQSARRAASARGSRPFDAVAFPETARAPRGPRGQSRRPRPAEPRQPPETPRELTITARAATRTHPSPRSSARGAPD